MKKYLKAWLVLSLIMGILTQSVSASFNQGTATITIQPHESQSLVGKKFNIYQLLKAENAVHLESINYTLNDKYAPALKRVIGKALNKEESIVSEYEVLDYMASLSDLPIQGAHAPFPQEGAYSKYRLFILDLRDTLVEMGIKGECVTISEVKPDGSFTISGLAYGYYLIDEVTDHQNQFAASSMCMVETTNPTAMIQIKSDYPTVSKQIQEDDKRQEIGNDGWNDMADFEIGQTIPYRFESHLPNMNGYDTYYYAWHDKMNDALTLHQDSISIIIADDKTSYTLKPAEWKLVMKLSEKETFMVEINNIKAIVDREFNKINENQENTYGQKVILTYNAHLNDLASKNSSFENSVLLEFSNNPDRDGQLQTGKTPWDTVVCFTYSLRGIKLNNHQEVLAGAKFKIYLDEKCEKEVYVKKTDDGFQVIQNQQQATEIISNQKGLFNIYGLDSGEYWLKEIESPQGYRPLLDPIQINIQAIFNSDRHHYFSGDKALIQLNASAYVKEFLDGLFGEKREKLDTNVQDGSINLTVINTVGSKLPHTGSNGLMICLVSGFIIVSFGATLFMKRKKDEKNKKK